jgi:hypothetical protein
MPAVRPGRQELETAKETLAEVFSVRPSGVEEMMRLRLEERTWGEEERWPERFCMGEWHHSLGILDPGSLSLAGRSKS